MDFSGQVLGHSGDQGYFFFMDGPEDHYPGPKFLSERVHQLPKGFLIYPGDFRGDQLYPLDGPDLGGEMVELAERALALLAFQLLLELLYSAGKLLDGG